MRAPTRGSFVTSGGYPSKLLTPTTCGPAPIAKSISVTAGMSEMMRAGCWLASTTSLTRGNGINTKITKLTMLTKSNLPENECFVVIVCFRLRKCCG